MGMFRDLGLYKREAGVLGAVRDYQLKRGKLAEAVQTGQRIVTVYHNAVDLRGEGHALLSLSQLLLSKDRLPLADRTAKAAHQVFSTCRDGEGVMKATDLVKTIKNAVLKDEIKDSIESFRHFANYPVNPCLEFGLSKQVPAMMKDVTKGL